MKSKHFLLFLYGELGGTQEFSYFINSLFQNLTDSQVKYVQDSYSAIIHFESKESIEAVSDLFNYMFDDRITAFFLFERPVKIGIRLDDRIFNHLMDLESPTSYKDINELFKSDDVIDDEFTEWNKREIENLGLRNDSPPPPFNEEEETVNDVKRIRQSYKQPFDMNTILDKILKNGVESLSSEEKKYLKNLSD